MFSGEYFQTSVSPGSVVAALIVGFVVYILTIILREAWRQWNLRRIFSGLPEPGERHWLYGHIHFVCIFVVSENEICFIVNLN